MGLPISRERVSRHRTKTSAGSFFSVYLAKETEVLRLHLDQTIYKGSCRKLLKCSYAACSSHGKGQLTVVYMIRLLEFAVLLC